MDTPDSVSIDEVPRFWFSRRWRLAVLCCVALLIITAQRVSVDVALASMLNHTAISATDNRSSLSHTAVNSLLVPSGDGHNVTRANVSRGSECFNTSDVAILTTNIFQYQDKGDIVWTASQVSIIIDAFHYGDLVGRLPGGLLSQRYGGKRLLGFALLLASLSTALVSVTARVHFSLVVLLRFIVGLSAGASMPAVSYLVGRWSPPDERSLLFSITNIGSVVCGTAVLIPLTGLLCEYGFDGGWPSVFYVFGGLGMMWFVVWMLLIVDDPLRDGRISREEREYILTCLTSDSHRHFNVTQDAGFPWAAALTSLPVFTLVLCQFTYDWVICIIQREVPAYFRQFLTLDIEINTVCAVLPGLAFWCVMMISASAADRLRRYGVLRPTNTRYLAHFAAIAVACAGAVLTSSMLVSLTGMTHCAIHWAGPLTAFVMALSFCGVQLGAGALVSHLDLASRHAAVIVGLTGTVGASTYFVLPAFRRTVSAAVQSELVQWRTLFIFTACAHLISALCFILLGATHRPNSAPPVDPASQAPPVDYEDPPSDKSAVHHTVSGLGGGVPDGEDEAVDSDTEYGSVEESLEQELDSAKGTRPVSRSLDTDRDLHLGQLMESIL